MIISFLLYTLIYAHGMSPIPDGTVVILVQNENCKSAEDLIHYLKGRKRKYKVINAYENEHMRNYFLGEYPNMCALMYINNVLYGDGHEFLDDTHDIIGKYDKNMLGDFH